MFEITGRNVVSNNRPQNVGSEILEQTAISNNTVSVSNFDSKTNLIAQYLDNLALGNKTQIQKSELCRPEYTNTGINDFENMVVRDKNDNVVQEVTFLKEGSKITQNISVKSVDGSSLQKVLTSDGNKKEMTINFIDKEGNTILKEERSYEIIDDNNAISVHNGEVYKISGLKGCVITVEHNGEKHNVDLNKFIANKTQNLNGSETGNNITDAQKEFLISRIKNRPGDIILKFADEIDSFVYLEGDGCEGWYQGYGMVPPEKRQTASRTLKTCGKADGMLELHELGHAVNELNDKSGQRWSDKNTEYLNARDIEIDNVLQNCTQREKHILEKFTTGGANFGKATGADEEFAELFGFINNMDIENVSYRTTLLIRNMPKSAMLACQNFS